MKQGRESERNGTAQKERSPGAGNIKREQYKQRIGGEGEGEGPYLHSAGVEEEEEEEARVGKEEGNRK